MKTIVFIFVCLLSISLWASDERCESDYQCESLCCHHDSGTCAPHSPKNNLFCNKPIGEICIASEFCKKSTVVECKIVKSGYKADGSVACTLRCPSVQKRSPCIDSICTESRQLPVPVFDPNDCSNAEDP